VSATSAPAAPFLPKATSGAAPTGPSSPAAALWCRWTRQQAETGCASSAAAAAYSRWLRRGRRLTSRSAHLTQLGGGRAKPFSRVVLSGNTRPGRKPRRAHTRGVDRGKAPRATNASRVTGSLLARVEGLEATLTPHRLIPFDPLGPSENPPQTPSKDPRKPLLRHPQSTLGKPSSNTLKGPLENPSQTLSKDPRKTPPSGLTGPQTRRTAEASNTALSRGEESLLRDTLAAPRGQGREVS